MTERAIDPLDRDCVEMASGAEREAEALAWIEGVLVVPDGEDDPGDTEITP
jgi:hypothetical protein